MGTAGFEWEPKMKNNMEALVFRGVPAGFFFRQGLIMQANGSEFGLPIAIVAFLVGAFLVFPIRPIWQPVVAIATGIGIADLVRMLGT